ncbi:sensor histidine kinase [Ohtaekwangia kribbensis]|jgi:signal transduction histidine kinase|uniref:histidine kinase n=1 Tax=Ohtaekwangia kribbensis TaxID=688913 RepID=A0ABW3K5Y7_9BACT
MRLLNVSLKSFLYYSMLLVLIGIPASFLSIRAISEKEIDNGLHRQQEEFVEHIKNFEYLEDIAVDLRVFDELAYDQEIQPADRYYEGETFRTIAVYDSIDREVNPYREVTSYFVVRNQVYKLAIRTSLVESKALVIVISIVQTILMILLLGGFLLINSSLSKKIWNPFYKTLSKLKAYELNKKEPFQYEDSNIAEFDDLNAAIRSLTNKNMEVFQQQKEFIENASHELQTPLAIFQSKLDLLMQDEALTEEQAALVKDLINTNQRLSKLNKSLLLLSKIENEQFIDKEAIDVTQLLHDSIAHYQELTGNGATNILQASPYILHGNKTLTDILINNLVRNAFQHTAQYDQIRIYLENGILSIENPGEPFKEGGERIFDRFYKESNHKASTGLGLAIVKKICDLSGYTLTYIYRDGRHIFSVKF